jgi:hypothetical protein
MNADALTAYFSQIFDAVRAWSKSGRAISISDLGWGAFLGTPRDRRRDLRAYSFGQYYTRQQFYFFPI